MPPASEEELEGELNLARRAGVAGRKARVRYLAEGRAPEQDVLYDGRTSRQVRIIELDAAQARPVLRSFATEVPVGVGFAKRSGLVREGTPEEFEAKKQELLGRL